MKLTTTTCYASRHGGIEETLMQIYNAGFSGVDLGLAREEEEWAQDTKNFLRKVKASSLMVGQSHGPIDFARRQDPNYTAQHLPMAELAISVAGQAGAPCIVFHPQTCPGLDSQQQMDWNLELFHKLGEKASAAGTKIALENTWGEAGTPCITPEEQIAYFDALNDPKRFTCCADLGHFFYMGHDPAGAIELLGRKRLGVLHIHDNDGRFDQHLMPYFGKIDWAATMKALDKIMYLGNLNMEVVTLNKFVPDANFGAGLRFLEQIGRTLMHLRLG